MNYKVFAILLMSSLILLPVWAESRKKDEKTKVLKSDVGKKIDETQKEIIRLKGVNDSLKKQYTMLEKNLSLLNDSIARIEKAREDLNDDLIVRCIIIGSYFLNVPYTEKGVELGIKAYDGSRGTSYYEKNIIRRNLLVNYKKDLEELLDFLRTAREVKTTLKKVIINARGSNKEYIDLLQQLNSLTFVKNYDKYNYRDITYLWGIYSDLKTLLQGCATYDSNTYNNAKNNAKSLGKKINEYGSQLSRMLNPTNGDRNGSVIDSIPDDLQPLPDRQVPSTYNGDNIVED